MRVNRIDDPAWRCDECVEQARIEIESGYALLRYCNRHGQQLALRVAKKVGGLP